MKTKPYQPTTAADLHRLWLGAVDKDGPFLSVPALLRVWAQGMPALPESARVMLSDAKPRFEKAWAAWDSGRIGASDETGNVPDSLPAYRAARDEWVRRVLTEMFGWGDLYTTDLAAAGQLDLTVGISSPRGNVRVVPSGALVRQDAVGALILTVDPVDSLRDPAADGWATSPVDRMEELLRRSGVPIGIVTDGRWWALVSARDQVMVASGIVDAQTWVQERATTAAFIELLGPIRLVGGRAEDRLPEIFRESVAAAEEITEALGVQVRRAVELLVHAISESAVEGRRRTGVDPLPARRADVYDAAVTVMMRVVFLLFAQERGLLPGEALFTAGYGISGELDALDQRAREEGAEALDGTHLTWHRLLATSQALFRGAPFEDLRLPAYHGSLFDPDRFSFLTALTDGGRLTLQVADRVMLEVLRSVQVAALRGQPARRISFRDIDVEQIGYIYEGLLGYSCEQVDEVTVGLLGTSGAEPEMPLTQLEALAAVHTVTDRFADAVRAAALKLQPDSKPASKAAMTKAMKLVVPDAERAMRAVTPDASLRERLRPLVGAIRRDLRDRPFVVLPGGLVVVETPSRASAGAHYTPKKLATEVVKHALEPLVFSPGPHQTPDSSRWVPLSSEALLNLRVADIACGSGAFLVAAARYLAAQLVEAWVRDETSGSTHDLEVKALRQVVANCLYGADINPLAVEMCKLSLWLVSLDQHLSFSFVDDKVLHGNALLGITSAEQLKRLRIDPEKASGQPSLVNLSVDEVLRTAAALRRNIASEVDDADPQRSHAAKERQMKRYDEVIAVLTAAADGVIAAGLRFGGRPSKALDNAFSELELAVGNAYPDLLAARVLFSEGEEQADRTALDHIIEAGLTPTVPTDYLLWKPLHWLLRVPDVMANGGFDAIIGNPPFLVHKRISSAIGTREREYLINTLGGGATGKVDYISIFLLRASGLARESTGRLGLITAKSIAEGVTREFGLGQLVDQEDAPYRVTRATRSKDWPGSAITQYSIIWLSRSDPSWRSPIFIDDAPVDFINSMLEPGAISDPPTSLPGNRNICHQGVITQGKGFFLSLEEGLKIIESEARNRDVVREYLGGSDVTDSPSFTPSRYVIDFGELDEVAASEYVEPWNVLVERVKPERMTKDAQKYPRMVHEWWKHWNPRIQMRQKLSDLSECLVIVGHTKHLAPARVSANLIPSSALRVFCTDSFGMQALLMSTPHVEWAVHWGSTLGASIRYNPSVVFESFPIPANVEYLAALGHELDDRITHELELQGFGLTSLLTELHENDSSPSDGIIGLRTIIQKVDDKLAQLYGWSDMKLNHGIQLIRGVQRYSLPSHQRSELFARLLAENRRLGEPNQGILQAESDAESFRTML